MPSSCRTQNEIAQNAGALSSKLSLFAPRFATLPDGQLANWELYLLRAVPAFFSAASCIFTLLLNRLAKSLAYSWRTSSRHCISFYHELSFVFPLGALRCTVTWWRCSGSKRGRPSLASVISQRVLPKAAVLCHSSSSKWLALH